MQAFGDFRPHLISTSLPVVARPEAGLLTEGKPRHTRKNALRQCALRFMPTFAHLTSEHALSFDFIAFVFHRHGAEKNVLVSAASFTKFFVLRRTR